MGIQPAFPKYVGVETLYFNTFTIGGDPFALSQVNNTREASGLPFEPRSPNIRGWVDRVVDSRTRVARRTRSQ
jgi:hypothetical protein